MSRQRAKGASVPYLIRLASLAILVLSATVHAAPLTSGKITRYDAALDAVITPDARIEKLAEGFTWAEGPVWIAAGYLLFTDVPENKMYRWSPAEGASVFLSPSGYAGPPLKGVREAGANGLHVDGAGSLLVADSGSRLVARLDLATQRRQTLAATYEGKRFNSPNDIARKRDGTIFFTDPPYGLEDGDDSPLKEMKRNGVYRIGTDGTVTLLEDSLTRPNGIGLSPDERTLYVANSDPANPIWMRYTLDAHGNVTDKRKLADASDLLASNAPGLPDGMAIAANGYLFASAPGGVLIMTPEGKRLGRIETGDAISNCAFGDDGRTLYLTSHKILARVRTRVAGSPLAR
jgi:gluconolactonase